MKRTMHIIRLSSVLLVTTLLYVACGEKEPIKPDDPVVEDDTIKVEVTTADAIDIRPSSATFTATCALTNAADLKGEACFYYSTVVDKAANIKLSGKKVSAGSVSAGSTSFSASVSGLEPATRYYYVASITINNTEYFGIVKSFVTLANEDKPVVFYQSDGIVRYINYSALDSVVNGADVTKYYFNDKRVAAYSKHALDSVSYMYPSGRTISAFPVASDFLSDIADVEAPLPTDKAEPAAPTDENDSAYGDYIENYTVKKTITFTWSDDEVTVSGSASGVTITKDKGHVTVKSTKGKMEYCLEGSTKDGSFKIADMDNSTTDDNNKKFSLKLNGVSITNPNGPAINIQSSKRVLVNLPVDKVNTLKDGATYTETEGESQKGTFFSEGQLIFSGPGTLNVISLGGHGICSDDYIRLRYNLGEINITSAKDGFNTKDYFLMYGGKVKVNATGDGVTVRRGPFRLYAGTLDITCVDDGIVSDYTEGDVAYVSIEGGDLKIATTGPKGHAVTTTGKLTLDDAVVTASTQGAASKCFTAGGDITISSSYVNLSTKGDPQYDEDEKDWSSAACIRAKGGLSITGTDMFLLSSGKGSKCINAAAHVNLDGSILTLAAKGADYDGNGNSVRSRAIDAASLTVNDGTSVCISAAMTAIYADTKFDVRGGNTFAYTQSEEAKAVNVKGTYSQTGGLLMSGLSK